MPNMMGMPNMAGMTMQGECFYDEQSSFFELS